MRKIMLLVLVVLSAVSCKENTNDIADNDIDPITLELKKLPKRAAVNAKAAAILKDWVAYNAFNTTFDGLYNVENMEDLDLVLEDLIEKQKELAESEYPMEFDIPQIKSRQKVVQTFILKTSATVEYRTDPTEPAIEMINAYNALRNQFNVIVNNTLDTNLLLDE
ncbi:MAG: hypothetical protein HKN52_03405 [Eudoraea sp.]|nr:hypothetical protein [Eudoraea sp.]